MSTTKLIREAIWKRTLTVEIAIASSDSRAEPSPTLRLRVRRNLYFPLYYPQIIAFFEPYCDITMSNLWLSFEEYPLRWTYPIGLLHDYLGDLESVWRLTLHTSDNPLLPFQGLEDIHTYWTNQIKESTYIQNGLAKRIMNLLREHSDALWRAVEHGDVDDYTHIWQMVRPEMMKQVPLKVYVPYLNKNVILREPVPAFSQEAETLGLVLAKWMPELFSGTPACKATVQGLCIPLDTVLWEACELLLYIDGFLHVVVGV